MGDGIDLCANHMTTITLNNEYNNFSHRNKTDKNVLNFYSWERELPAFQSSNYNL